VRVIVTGSRGFVGHWLTAHLAEYGDEVLGLDAEVDITDATALTDAVSGWVPDAICHLAAQASVGASWAGQGDTYQVNTIGTLNVLLAASACPVRPRVLVISSSEVYGRVSPYQLPLAEGQPFAPVSPCAASKAAAEMIGMQAWLGSGLEVIRARPFNHTGPGQRPDFVVPALAKQVAEAVAEGKAVLRTGNLDARRDITDVRDVVRAYRALLVAGVPGEAYNVCRGTALSIREVADRLLALAGVDMAIEVDPARIRPSDVPELRGDPSKIAGATGWAPQVPFDTTLADTLASFQNRPAG